MLGDGVTTPSHCLIEMPAVRIVRGHFAQLCMLFCSSVNTTSVGLFSAVGDEAPLVLKRDIIVVIALLSRSRLPHTMSDRWKSLLRTAADRRRSTACCEAPSLACSRVEPHTTSYNDGVHCLNTYEKKFEQERLSPEGVEDDRQPCCNA